MRAANNTTKIDACVIKNSEEHEGYQVEIDITSVESVLSTRVSNETFSGIINVMKAFLLDATKSEIEKALVSH